MNKFLTFSALAAVLSFSAAALAKDIQPAAGGFNGPSIGTVSVAEAVKLSDDSPVVLQGKIEKSLGGEKYLFRDATGTLTLDIDNEDWRGVNITPADTVEIRGEIDKEMLRDPEVDVDTVIKK